MRTCLASCGPLLQRLFKHGTHQVQEQATTAVADAQFTTTDLTAEEVEEQSDLLLHMQLEHEELQRSVLQLRAEVAEKQHEVGEILV